MLFRSWISGLPNGAFRKSHVQAFYDLALQRDSSVSNGLFYFLEYLRKSRQEFKTVSPVKDSNAVRIMSVHKSKGLEFPVVFLADTAKQFNTGRDPQGQRRDSGGFCSGYYKALY